MEVKYKESYEKERDIDKNVYIYEWKVTLSCSNFSHFSISPFMLLPGRIIHEKE